MKYLSIAWYAFWQYVWNLLHLFDQTVNCIVFFGDPRETLSARMGRDLVNGRCKTCKFVCYFLNWFQLNHCTDAWEGEEQTFQPTAQITGD